MCQHGVAVPRPERIHTPPRVQGPALARSTTGKVEEDNLAGHGWRFAARRGGATIIKSTITVGRAEEKERDGKWVSMFSKRRRAPGLGSGGGLICRDGDAYEVGAYRILLVIPNLRTSSSRPPATVRPFVEVDLVSIQRGCFHCVIPKWHPAVPAQPNCHPIRAHSIPSHEPICIHGQIRSSGIGQVNPL